MIRDGDIEGGRYLTNQRQRWFVYSDQLSPPPRPTPNANTGYSQLADDVEALRAEVAAAQAAAAAAQETSRLLLASQGILLSALDDYRQGAEEVAAAADDYRQLADRHHTAAARYRGSADQFAQVLGNYRDIIGQSVTPGDLSSLPEEETRP
jgi:soluble cytochrome b562